MMSISKSKVNEYKAMSMISNDIHIFEINDKKYVVFNKVIIPFRLALLLILWEISDTLLFEKQTEIDTVEFIEFNSDVLNEREKYADDLKYYDNNPFGCIRVLYNEFRTFISNYENKEAIINKILS